MFQIRRLGKIQLLKLKHDYKFRMRKPQRNAIVAHHRMGTGWTGVGKPKEFTEDSSLDCRCNALLRFNIIVQKTGCN